ncbi:hypothetical protein RRG08_004360 [Elysia crispata]|uniref:Uncharacterized protein n=1 Tax=Elysia crispata TaxID=231223 RepID=A0AAE1DBN2_9GAST|nr:hypothetical protein RRG08_004360 [Elysia crispata]
MNRLLLSSYTWSQPVESASSLLVPPGAGWCRLRPVKTDRSEFNVEVKVNQNSRERKTCACEKTRELLGGFLGLQIRIFCSGPTYFAQWLCGLDLDTVNQRPSAVVSFSLQMFWWCLRRESLMSLRPISQAGSKAFGKTWRCHACGRLASPG